MYVYIQKQNELLVFFCFDGEWLLKFAFLDLDIWPFTAVKRKFRKCMFDICRLLISITIT